ncbi:MAG: TonB-dependent receptor [Bacteroidetes bacterium]|nr:TonB-dependent receptor [Bacteroidota bacterium]
MAQQSTGTLEVRVQIQQISRFQGFTIRLFESRSGKKAAEYDIPDDSIVTIHDLPFGTYNVWLVEGTDAIVAGKRVSINSAVEVKIVLGNVIEKKGEEIVVEAVTPDMSKPVISTPYTAQSISELPAFSGPKKMEAILLNTPGVVPDEDGRMHVRGEDAMLQYVIDGIPITTNMTRIYSSLFNPNLIKSADILRGGLNAEYGISTSAIVNITTRSGFDKPFFADGSASIGSWGTRDRALAVGGNLGGRGALFLSYAGSETDRYTDPVSNWDPIHNDGYSHNYFGKADFLLTDDLDLVVIGSRNLSNFGIANHADTSTQNQREDVSDWMLGGRLNWTIGESSALSLLAYKRHSEQTNMSGGLNRIVTAADSVAALRNEDFFVGSHRENDALGGMLEFSANTKWFDVPNVVKVGVGGERFPTSEYFSFAVVNDSLAYGESGDYRYQRYDIRHGGKPFLVDTSNTGTRFSAYVQDQLAFDRWVVNAGVRFDAISMVVDETGISPRLSAAYKLTDDIWLRGSYNRQIMQAPIENILVSSSPQARVLVDTAQGAVPTSVMAEREHVFDIGGTWRINEYLDLDLDGYAKFIDNFIAKVELGVSGIIFPINIKQGRVLGGDLTVNLHHWNHFSGKLSLSFCDSRGLKPDDGSTPIAAGLILGEEGASYSHPFAGEDAFQTEHNQPITASFTLNYDLPGGLFATLGGRFDSGLPFDLAKDGVGLDEAASRAELKRRGYSDEVIDLLGLTSDMPGSPDKSSGAHIVLDLAAGYDLKPALNIPAKITGTILNVLDTKYLYKFESSFGGTHFGLPRTYQLNLEVRI